MMNLPRFYNSAGMMVCRPVVFHFVIMSIVFHLVRHIIIQSYIVTLAISGVNLQKAFMKSIFATGVILLIGGFITAISYGQATTSTEKFTLSLFGVDNFCGPTPEFVSLTGNVNIIVHFTLDANGGAHVMDAHHNFQDAKGVGEITGTKYVFTSAGVDNHFNIKQTSFNEFIAFSHGRLLSQGGQPNQLASFQVHFTIHPDGKITGELENIKFVCT